MTGADVLTFEDAATELQTSVDRLVHAARRGDIESVQLPGAQVDSFATWNSAGRGLKRETVESLRTLGNGPGGTTSATFPTEPPIVMDGFGPKSNPFRQ